MFRVGSTPGDAAKFKIVNNLLAAVNLAAGAEALALAVRAGLDPRQVVDVINASSGGSWIFADRMPRALAGDFAPARRDEDPHQGRDDRRRVRRAPRRRRHVRECGAGRVPGRWSTPVHGELDDAAIRHTMRQERGSK